MVWAVTSHMWISEDWSELQLGNCNTEYLSKLKEILEKELHVNLKVCLTHSFLLPNVPWLKTAFQCLIIYLVFQLPLIQCFLKLAEWHLPHSRSGSVPWQLHQLLTWKNNTREIYWNVFAKAKQWRWRRASSRVPCCRLPMSVAAAL